MDKEGKLLLCRIIEKKTALKILRFLHELNEDGSGVSMTDKKINVLSSSGTTTQKACDGVCRIDQIEALNQFSRFIGGIKMKHISGGFAR